MTTTTPTTMSNVENCDVNVMVVDAEDEPAGEGVVSGDVEVTNVKESTIDVKFVISLVKVGVSSAGEAKNLHGSPGVSELVSMSVKFKPTTCLAEL